MMIAAFVVGKTNGESLKEGATVELNGRKATLKKLDYFALRRKRVHKAFQVRFVRQPQAYGIAAPL